MLRKKPTTRLDVIGKLNLEPVAALPEYIESKIQEKYFIKQPNHDNAGDSLELWYSGNMIEYNRMMEIQKNMVEHEKHQAKILEKHTELTAKSIAKLSKLLFELDSFLRDFQEKRDKAEKEIADQEELQENLNNRINALSEENKIMHKFKDSLQATAEEYKPYEDVIEEVIKNSNLFESVKDCINRCDGLMMAQDEISYLNSHKLEEIDDMKQRMIQLIREAAQTVLGLKTELEKNARSYNKSKAEVFYWESALRQTKYNIYVRETNKEVIIDAINQLFHMLRIRTEEPSPKVKRRAVETQLDFIRDEIIILNKVLEKCNKILGNKETSTVKMNEIEC